MLTQAKSKWLDSILGHAFHPPACLSLNAQSQNPREYEHILVCIAAQGSSRDRPTPTAAQTRDNESFAFRNANLGSLFLSRQAHSCAMPRRKCPALRPSLLPANNELKCRPLPYAAAARHDSDGVELCTRSRSLTCWGVTGFRASNTGVECKVLHTHTRARWWAGRPESRHRRVLDNWWLASASQSRRRRHALRGWAPRSHWLLCRTYQSAPQRYRLVVKLGDTAEIGWTTSTGSTHAFPPPACHSIDAQSQISTGSEK